MGVYAEFEWREVIYGATEGVSDLLERERVTCYIGFDPTASSLHVGNLLQMMALARLQRFGHSPIALVGGGTGLVGDPSGKSQERKLLSREEAAANAEAIRAQLAPFLDFEARSNPARLVDNLEWLGGLGFMEFLREVGKHFMVNSMLAKESVKRRLESADGLSYTEFSYLLLQAYDFLVLHDRYGCRLQLGGSDQWGNIVAGCDLIRRLRGAQAYGLVLPLITTADGAKLGKTEQGTVWLDPARTSPFRFYQFWLNTEDRDAGRYLKVFTDLSRDAIDELTRSAEAAPERRELQRTLARDVTRRVHGEDQCLRAERASALLFGGALAEASAEDILTVFDDVPSVTIRAGDLEAGIPAADLAVTAGLTASKGEAARLIRQGGFYVNDRRLAEERGRVTMADTIDRAVVILRKGARERRLVRVEG